VHPSPEHALSDGAQSLDRPEFARLMRDVQSLADTLGRPVACPAGVRA
jgi:3-deoxy-D-arabino-heptulosonate 7-phosphate (DAHP) synthase